MTRQAFNYLVGETARRAKPTLVCTLICCVIPAGSTWRTKAWTRGSFRIISDTAISLTPHAIRERQRPDLKVFGTDCEPASQGKRSAVFGERDPAAGGGFPIRRRPKHSEKAISRPGKQMYADPDSLLVSSWAAFRERQHPLISLRVGASARVSEKPCTIQDAINYGRDRKACAVFAAVRSRVLDKCSQTQFLIDR